VGVITSLEALSVETLFARRHGGLLLVVALAGGDKFVVGQAKWGLPTSRHDVCPPVGGWGSSPGCRSAAHSVPRRLVLLDNLQCGAGQC
jgi:hypothetical protein